MMTERGMPNQIKDVIKGNKAEAQWDFSLNPSKYTAGLDTSKLQSQSMVMKGSPNRTSGAHKTNKSHQVQSEPKNIVTVNQEEYLVEDAEEHHQPENEQ